MTRNSRSMACAEGSSLAAGPGLERITYEAFGVVSLKVGFDCPPLNCSTCSGPEKSSIWLDRKRSSAEMSKACCSATGLVPVKVSMGAFESGEEVAKCGS